METGSFSRMAKKCAVCEFKNDCDNKRLEACAYIIPQSMAMPASTEISMPTAADLAAKHDYRDIKIAENTTITIDLEDMKRQLANSLSPMCFLEYGG